MLTIEAPDFVYLRLRGERLAEKQRRAQIDRHLPVEARRVERADLVRLEARGVVDQQRERPERGGRRADKSGDRRMIREVRLHDAGAPAGAHDVVAQRLGLPHRALRMDRDRVSGRVQRERDRAADAARPSGHQCGSVRHST